MLDNHSDFDLRKIPFHKLVEVIDYFRKSGRGSEAARLEQAISSARKSYEKDRLDNILTRINEAMTKGDVERDVLLKEIFQDLGK